MATPAGWASRESMDDRAQVLESRHDALPARPGGDAADGTAAEIGPGIAHHVLRVVDRVLQQTWILP